MTKTVKPCRVYQDSETAKYTIRRGRWKGGGKSIVRYEPFVLAAYVRYTDQSTGGPVIGTEGGAARFRVQPIESDNRTDPVQVGAPVFDVDGGLIAVPFAAQVQLVWPDIPDTAAGVLLWSLTSYGPELGEGMPVLGITEWHETRLLTDAQTIPVPTNATRVLVPDSNYGVRVSLYGGAITIEAPLTPVSLMGSPDVRVDILTNLSSTVNPNRVPLQFYY